MVKKLAWSVLQFFYSAAAAAADVIVTVLFDAVLTEFLLNLFVWLFNISLIAIQWKCDGGSPAARFICPFIHVLQFSSNLFEISFVLTCLFFRTADGRSTNQSTTAVNGFDLHLRRSNSLIDDNFVYILRDANQTKLVDDYDALINQYSSCFYRNENSAIDLCDGDVVSIIHSMKESPLFPLET